MDPVIKEQWLEALRSGQYRQGKTRLRNRAIEEKDDTFCCLGVLCDIVKDRVADGRWVPERDLYTFETAYGRSSASLPSSVSNLTGVPTYECEVLMRMNDSGDSFKKIAKYVEGNL